MAHGSMTERMRAAAIRGQAAALEMQEAVSEMLTLANEVEDFAERQEDALMRLCGQAKPPVAGARHSESDTGADIDGKERKIANRLGAVDAPPNYGEHARAALDEV